MRKYLPVILTGFVVLALSFSTVGQDALHSIQDAWLSLNVPLLNGTQTFTGANTFNNIGNSFGGSGAGLTGLSFYRAGQQAIASLSTSQAVTFSSALVNTNYSVAITPDSTLAAAIGFSATAKTTSGFTITLSGGITGGVTVDYLVIPNK